MFDGQWGSLDHALASASLSAQVTGTAEYHINADEPSVLDYNTEFKSTGQQTSLYAADEFRVSDHDPVVVGLNLETASAAPVAFGAFGRRSAQNQPTPQDTRSWCPISPWAARATASTHSGAGYVDGGRLYGDDSGGHVPQGDGWRL